MAVAEFLAGRLGFAAIPALVEADAGCGGAGPVWFGSRQASKKPLTIDRGRRSMASTLLPAASAKFTKLPPLTGIRSAHGVFLRISSLWGGGFTGALLPFLFVLTIVVFFHELGHFLVARLCGVRVLTFSVGFGPEIVGFNDRHGTRWKISAIPLGGYVKFFGDEDAASAPDQSASPS